MLFLRLWICRPTTTSYSLQLLCLLLPLPCSFFCVPRTSLTSLVSFWILLACGLIKKRGVHSVLLAIIDMALVPGETYLTISHNLSLSVLKLHRIAILKFTALPMVPNLSTHLHFHFSFSSISALPCCIPSISRSSSCALSPSQERSSLHCLRFPTLYDGAVWLCVNWDEFYTFTIEASMDQALLMPIFLRLWIEFYLIWGEFIEMRHSCDFGKQAIFVCCQVEGARHCLRMGYSANLNNLLLFPRRARHCRKQQAE